jgi:starvation-inducible DNA-binding protein
VNKIAIPDNVRNTSIDRLNARLADAIDLQLSLKQAHWNIKGPSFIALHELFDQIAGRVMGHADDIAERVKALGGMADGTVQTVSAASSLPAYPAKAEKQSDHISALSDRFAKVGASMRHDLDEIAATGDQVTVDLLTSVVRSLDKDLWFIEAHSTER